MLLLALLFVFPCLLVALPALIGLMGALPGLSALPGLALSVQRRAIDAPNRPFGMTVARSHRSKATGAEPLAQDRRQKISDRPDIPTHAFSIRQLGSHTIVVTYERANVQRSEAQAKQRTASKVSKVVLSQSHKQSSAH